MIVHLLLGYSAVYAVI